MKKQYISPSMECIKIKAVSMLAGSLPKNSDPNSVISDNDAVLGRGFLDFEDDEED
jgi:hypothetical protein